MNRVKFDGSHFCFSSETVSGNIEGEMKLEGDFIIDNESIALLRVLVSKHSLFYVQTCSTSSFSNNNYRIYGRENVEKLILYDLEVKKAEIKFYQGEIREMEQKVFRLKEIIEEHNMRNWYQRLMKIEL